MRETEEIEMKRLGDRRRKIEEIHSKTPLPSASPQRGELKKREQSLCAKNALKGQNISARGNALGQENNVNFFAPRLNIFQSEEFVWGKKENIEYRMMNNECRSGDLEALKGRNITAQCEALCNNATTNPIAPRIAIVQDDSLAWGKTEEKENRSLSSQHIKNGYLEEINLNLGLRFERNPRCNGNDNSNRQRTDGEFSTTIFINNSTIIMESFSFSPPWEGPGEASNNIYLN